MIPYRPAAVNKNRDFRSQDSRAARRRAGLPSGTAFATQDTSQNMALTLSDVKRIAHLARIEISGEEAGQALGQLNGIFVMIERLQSVDTAGIEPMSHPLGGGQRLREDRATASDIRDAALANAPAGQDGLFLVPKVIE
jgi:aspartyl-tRNA(Asn)/glutamyl-tRNA(Gln) amidotransferase subunit C